MSRNLFIIICLLVCFVNADNRLPMKRQLSAISKAEQLYNQAIELREEGNSYDAIQVISKAIVHHANE